MPTEEEVKEAVNNLQRNISGGPSGMRDEHLKGWFAASKRGGEKAAEEGEGKMEDEEGGPTKPH